MRLKSYQIDRRLLRTGAVNFSASGLKRQDNDLIANSARRSAKCSWPRCAASSACHPLDARLWLRTCMDAPTIQPSRTLSHKRTGRGAGSHMKARGMTDKEEWFVWNGSMGILDMVTIGAIEDGEGGRSAFLAPPYDVVGPFSLDELETRGRIAFGACLVMSRQRWQEDQVELRREGREKRRAFLFQPDFDDDDREHREILNLPTEGALKPSDINAAFRRLAKTAHPDAGGSDEHLPPHRGSARRATRAIHERLIIGL